jgi:hypothetical protein
MLVLELEHISKIPKDLIWIQDLATDDIVPLTTYFEKNYPEYKYELGPGKKEIIGLYGDPDETCIYQVLRKFYNQKLSALNGFS